MKYKLIAIDLDGTLLNDEKNIPVENRELLRKLIDKGYEIVIATGRRYWSAKMFVRDINNHLVILANNGTIVRKSKDDTVLMTKYMNPDDYRVLVKEGKKKNLYPIVHVNNYDEGYDIIIEVDETKKKYNNYLYQDPKRLRQVQDIETIRDPKVLTVVYVGEKDELEDLHLTIQGKYPKTYSSHIMHNITSAGGLLEVMHPEGCKWLSLIEYAEGKGVSREEIIAIGDDNNDIEMIKKAGLGIAMKNGTEMVRKSADIITEKDNNESGLAYTLSKILEI